MKIAAPRRLYALVVGALALAACGAETAPDEPAPVAATEPAVPTPAPTPPPPLQRTLRTVVIDAGHGGEELGAEGISGVLEKDITLAISRATSRELQARGFTVVETRTADLPVTLSRRSGLGNASGAGLFVSIHANSAPSDRAFGIETYSMALASDEAAMRLAERENRMLQVQGREWAVPDAIVEELRQTAVAQRSADFAAVVQREMVAGLQGFYGRDRIVDRGARTAPFWVLVDSEVPAVLVEVGYLSNEVEERRLRTGGYHTRVAAALADGIEAWVVDQEERAADEGDGGDQAGG